MTDLLLLIVVVAFFAVAVLLVRFCEWIIGPDEPSPTDEPAGDDTVADRPRDLVGV